MYKAIVFAGTTEGYEICRFLSANKISALACVATEYGSHSLEAGDYLKIQAKRLDEQEMTELFHKELPEFILDATHPYATEVTKNIKSAALASGISYIRVLRAESQSQNAVYVETAEQAVEYLRDREGRIFLTTGSKELAAFTTLPDYQERIYARVLSLPAVVEACQKLGFEGKHLIAMQGPFSKEMNEATLRQYECQYLVTKDSGKAGGFQEKIDAAFACGVIPVIIGRPVQEEGISLTECKRMLAKYFFCEGNQHITLLGIGMGSEDTLTIQGKRAVEKADLIIGARRVTDAVALPGQEVFYEYRSREIVDYIQNHPEYSNIVVALSGDVVYFMSKIGLSWDNAKIVSAHGKNCNLISLIYSYEKTFAILGTADGVAELAKKLTGYGMGEVIVYVGEKLSYPDEKIFAKMARELTDYKADPLSVVCVYNPEAEPLPATHGMPDEVFLRGKAPMTKSEVRSVSLTKLKLDENSICYDIGAGTGSVSVEMALRASQGQVYAIEKKEDALNLLKANKKKFALDQMQIIAGTAPEAMEDLPAPTHAFIGGSSGNLDKIINLLLAKNPQVRIVINCITLETVSEAISCIRKLEEFGADKEWESEVVQLAVSRAKNIGRYHMMMGENPIYIITVQAHKKEMSLREFPESFWQQAQVEVEKR